MPGQVGGAAKAGWWRCGALDDRMAALLFASLAILAIAIFRDYGVSWDEPLHDRLGRAAIAYYAAGLGEPYAPAEKELDRQYGGLFDVGRILASHLSPVGPWETGHLLCAIVGLVGAIGCWRLSRLLFGPRAALASAVLLVLTPSWFGHMFINPKDIPFAAGYIWAVHLLVRCLQAVPMVPWRRSAGFAVALGLTLAIKVPAAIVGVYALAGVPAVLLLQPRPPGARRSVATAAAIAYLRLGLPALLIAYPIMLLFWPWAQAHPIGNPLRALATFADFRDAPGRVLLDGHRYGKLDVPRSYMPLYLAVKLPEIALLALALAVPAALAGGRRLWQSPGREKIAHVGVVALAAALPVGLQIAMRSTQYDEIRHDLFVLPPLAVLLGPILARGFDWLARRSAGLRLVGLAGIAAYGLYHVSLLVRLHPYQYAYFNALVGGVAGVEGRFNTEYWQTNRREAIGQLAAFLAGEGRADRPVVVGVCLAEEMAAIEFPGNFRLPRDKEVPEFLLTPSMNDYPTCAPSGEAREIATVHRLGATFGRVLQLQGPR